jgi:extracellular matrix regulatory protein A
MTPQHPAPSTQHLGGRMPVDLLHVGFGSMINLSRVLAIVDPDSQPIKRLIQQAREDGKLIEATYGRKTKALVVLDTGHLLTAALEPRTLMRRVRDEQDAKGGFGEGA